MPLDTQTYDLESTIQDLEAEREDLADRMADADPESPAAQQLIEEGQQVDRYLSGLEWYRAEFDADELTLGALTNGERHRVQDVAGDTAGARQNAYVAMGTVDGAYLEHDPEAVTNGDLSETTMRVADLHPAFVDWAEQEITELGRMDGDTGKSFRALVLERRIQATSEATNG